ncbi:hypothetical protein ACGFYQ_33865 [Streptomyces sp. NPDC048258]|uniref:hypothetical protein n=1 Tax=Streptomyces sp. NPDC048258 TaxID=3365527 RepID=UPI0037228A93
MSDQDPAANARRDQHEAAAAHTHELGARLISPPKRILSGDNPPWFRAALEKAASTPGALRSPCTHVAAATSPMPVMVWAEQADRPRCLACHLLDQAERSCCACGHLAARDMRVWTQRGQQADGVLLVTALICPDCRTPGKGSKRSIRARRRGKR